MYSSIRSLVICKYRDSNHFRILNQSVESVWTVLRTVISANMVNDSTPLINNKIQLVLDSLENNIEKVLHWQISLKQNISSESLLYISVMQYFEILFREAAKKMYFFSGWATKVLLRPQSKNTFFSRKISKAKNYFKYFKFQVATIYEEGRQALVDRLINTFFGASL